MTLSQPLPFCLILYDLTKTLMYFPDNMKKKADDSFFFFFYLCFLLRTFTIHETAGEGGGYLFNSSLPLPPASQTLRH